MKGKNVHGTGKNHPNAISRKHLITHINLKMSTEHIRSLNFSIQLPFDRSLSLSALPLTRNPTHLPQTSTKSHMDSIGSSSSPSGFDQNVIVMRHGDRMDNFDPLWVKTAERPWDPPLVNAGRVRAFSTGRLLRSDRVGFQIHRVFVSPFLRCIQTALEATTAICAANDESKKVAADCGAIDPSKVKVSIEYGLCEMLNREAIRQECAPKDGNFHFNTSELEALLPAGIVDHNVERIYEELPRWEETVLGARARYEQVIKALADKYPSENLLLVTHGEGVGSAVSLFLEGAVVHEVNYCAYSHARRCVVFDEAKTHKAGRFELVTPTEETGIKYYTGENMMSEDL